MTPFSTYLPSCLVQKVSICWALSKKNKKTSPNNTSLPTQEAGFPNYHGSRNYIHDTSAYSDVLTAWFWETNFARWRSESLVESPFSSRSWGETRNSKPWKGSSLEFSACWAVLRSLLSGLYGKPNHQTHHKPQTTHLEPDDSLGTAKNGWMFCTGVDVSSKSSRVKTRARRSWLRARCREFRAKLAPGRGTTAFGL